MSSSAAAIPGNLAQVDTFGEAGSMLKEYADQGRLRHGTVRGGGAEAIPADAYVAVFDRHRGFPALLTPASAGAQTNLKTNQQDSINNYNTPDYAFIWFQLL